jgi:hypothetical protein
MRKKIGLAAIAGLTAALASAQTAAPAQAAPAAVATPVPVTAAPVAAEPAPAPAVPPVTLPVPAPVMRLVDPPVILVETLPPENPFATVVDAPAMMPVKPVAADAVIGASLFATIRVDPKGKAVAVRRARDPIPSLTAQSQSSLLRWTFDPGRKSGQAVETWTSLRLDLAVEIDSPKIEQALLTPITPTTPIAKPVEWGTDAAWLERLKPGPPVEGTIPNEQLDTPPVPKKQPWSSSSYKGPFSVKFWVRINGSGRVEKSIPLTASDPVLIPYFRKAIDSWLFRPARAAGAAVTTWNELLLGGQISFSTDLKLTASLRQSL